MGDFGDAMGNLVYQLAKVGAGLAGVSAITSGLIQGFQAFNGIVRASFGIVRVAFQAIADVAKAVVAGFKGVEGLLTGLATALGGVIGGILGTLENVVHATVQAFTSLVDATTKLVTGIIALGAAAAPGGIQMFSQTMQYLTSVIGSVVTPIFTTFAAVVLSIADYLKGSFLAAAKSVAVWLGDNLQSVIETTIKALASFIQNVDEYGTRFVNIIDSVVVGLLNFKDRFLMVIDYISVFMKTALSGISEAIGRFLSYVPGMGDKSKQYISDAEKGRQGATEDAQRAADRAWDINSRNEAAKKRQDERSKSSQDRQAVIEGTKGPGGGIDQAIADVLAKVGGNLKEAVKAMKNELAKSANTGYSGLTDIHKQIQTQAFQNNIQQRTLDTQIKILQVLEGMASRGLNRGPQPGMLAP